MTWSIEAGAEIQSIARLVGAYTQNELNTRRMLGGSGSDNVGYIAMSGPGFEQPYGFEEQAFKGAAIMVLWSGTDASDKKGLGRETPSPTYKDELNSLFQHLRQWRHCIAVGPGSAKSWGLSPRFDQIIEHSMDYLDGVSVPRVSPAKVCATIGERDHMHFDIPEATVAMA